MVPGGSMPWMGRLIYAIAVMGITSALVFGMIWSVRSWVKPDFIASG